MLRHSWILAPVRASLPLFTFFAVTIAQPTPTAASALTTNPNNPRWLYQNGVPFFFCGPGDPEGFLHRGSLNQDGTRNGDQDAIIQKMAGTGANCIYITAVLSHGGDGGATDNPFVNHDPAQGLNDAVLDQWDGWISDLNAAGVLVFFLLYDDGTLVWNTGSSVGPDEADFVSTIVNRFEDHDLLVWCVAEEYSEALSTTRASAIAALIDSEDDRHHPISVHQTPNTSFDFPEDASVESFAMQCAEGGSAQSVHDDVVEAWDIADGRYNVIMAEFVGHYTDRTFARRVSWAAAMGGGCVMVQAMDVATTPVEALEDCGRLAAFFQTTPFDRMAPADALARAETDYVFGAPDVGYILYSSSLAQDLGVHLESGVGTVDLSWMDCITGTIVSQTGVPAAAGDNAWRKPIGLGNEVVLSVIPAGASNVSSSTWAEVKALYRDSTPD